MPTPGHGPVLDGGSRFAVLIGLIGVLAGLVTVVAATAADEVALRVSDLTTVSAAAAATVFSLRARLHGAVRRF